MHTNFDKKFFEKFWQSRLSFIENHLRKLFRNKKAEFASNILMTAMNYSVMSGGKRLRPILVLASAEVAGASGGDFKIPTHRTPILDGACAVELIHTYSLIHDDLPALDNDDYRRGKLSSHKKFGEDMAILAGDALLTMAFELLSRAIRGLKDRIDASLAADIVSQTALAAGKEGMVGGQVADIKFSSKIFSKKIKTSPPSKIKTTFIKTLKNYRRLLDYIHLNKTARLIELSCLLGGMLSGADSVKKKALSDYGRKIGLAFQITDDLLDDSPQSSDAKNFRLTYPSLYSRDDAVKQAENLCNGAVRSLGVFPSGSPARKFLEMMAEFILKRKK